jgi:hypothetical protein
LTNADLVRARGEAALERCDRLTEPQCGGKSLVDPAAAEPRLAVNAFRLAQHQACGAAAVAAEVEQCASTQFRHEAHVVRARQDPEEGRPNRLDLPHAR